MSLLDSAKFHLNVTIGGNSAVRVDRWRSELKMLKPGFWKHDHLAPPLKVSPRLKELIFRHYLKGRFANLDRKVAWVTSGGPVELLTALGYFVIYPENHGAVCGIRRAAEELCEVAEDAGYSRDICSYARTDIGSVLSGKTPVGKLPKPDLLLCCNNICQTVLFWYQVLAEHFEIPLIVVDTPFIYTEADDHAVAYTQRQLEEAIAVAERVAGKELSERNMQRVMRNAKDAVELWAEILACGRQRPSPITAFDEFIHMAPIVEMRGEAFTVDYYAAMLDELRTRIADGTGALLDERKRLLWDNLPIWYRVRWMSELLATHGIALVASTYTNAWGELAPLIDPRRPLESAARVYLHPILNRGVGDKLEKLRSMVKEYRADGVMLHSDRSCKPYSIGQVDQRDQLAGDVGVPSLLLEADHSDPRVFSEQQVENRIAAFMEMLGV